MLNASLFTGHQRHEEVASLAAGLRSPRLRGHLSIAGERERGMGSLDSSQRGAWVRLILHKIHFDFDEIVASGEGGSVDFPEKRLG